MKLGPEELQVLRRIDDEAIASCRERGGKIDHVAAALHRHDALLELEAAGFAWAATVRDAAELEGHRKAISRRVKAKMITIPVPTGSITLPAAYSRRRKDGGQQMNLWLYIDLGDLEKLVDEMQGKSKTLTDRALAMRCGLDLARKHGVDTAAEGFAAEGIDVGVVAA